MFTNKLKYDSVANAVRGVVEASEKELDEALKGNQKKIDKNHNNKIDGQDFKILRGQKKEVKKEEVEQIDEGMQQILRKVVPGYAKKQINDKMDAGKFGKTDADKDANYHRYKKVMDKVKKEEVEQIDELKKSTIKSYIKKKHDDMYKTDAPPSMSTVKKTMTNLQRAHDRNTGVKPTSEEVDQVQEVAPPGFEGTVKAMKKHKDIDNPFALAWSMKNKGYKSHKNDDGTTKKEDTELTLRGFRRVLDEKLNTKKKTVDTLEGPKKVSGEHDNEHTSAKVELNSEEEKKPNAFDWKSFTKRGPQPNGGAGKKQGTRYGGSKQKDEPADDDEKKK
jgi:hypothetical protein